MFVKECCLTSVLSRALKVLIVMHFPTQLCNEMAVFEPIRYQFSHDRQLI